MSKMLLKYKNVLTTFMFHLNICCALNNITFKNGSMSVLLEKPPVIEPEGNFTNVTYSNQDDLPEYKTGCDHSSIGKMYLACSPCEVCVDNECLPYVMKEIFTKNCSLVDKCRKFKCGKFKCHTLYGFRTCECPPNYFGSGCQEEAQLNGNINTTISDVRVVYEASVPAGSLVTIMTAWKDLNPSRQILVSYSFSVGETFIEKREYNHVKFIPQRNPFQDCQTQKILGDEFCIYLPHDTNRSYTVGSLTAEFPFHDPEKKHPSLKLENRTLPGNRVVIGYYLKFILKILDNSTFFIHHSEHPIFVYYKNPEVAQSHCFTREMEPSNVCVSHSTEEDEDLVSINRVYRKDKIVIKVNINWHENCSYDSSTTTMQPNYLLWADVVNFDERKGILFNSTGSELIIDHFLLPIGRYRVKITSNVKWKENNKTLSGTNFIMCWFNIVQLPLIADIDGGDARTVYANDDLVLDASHSMDPNNPESRQQSLFFMWKCNETDIFCQPHQTKGRRYVIKAPLRPGITFKFTLKVFAFKIQASYDYQEIITTDVKFASFVIQCLLNCFPSSPITNPDKAMYLEANTTGLINPKEGFIWSFQSSDKKESKENIMDQQTLDYVALIKPGALMEDTNYTFTAERQNPVGVKASIKITTGRRPIFDCKVHPRVGYRLQTKFNIKCETKSLDALQYTFFVKSNYFNGLPIFLSQNETGLLQQVYLISNNIQVKATTASGCYRIRKFMFKLLRNSSFERSLPTKIDLFNIVSQPHVRDSSGLLNNLVYLCYVYKQRKRDYTFKWRYIYLKTIVQINEDDTFRYMRYLSALTKLILMNPIPPLGRGRDGVMLKLSLTLLSLTDKFYSYHDFFQKDVFLTGDEISGIATSLFMCYMAVVRTVAFSQPSRRPQPKFPFESVLGVHQRSSYDLNNSSELDDEQGYLNSRTNPTPINEDMMYKNLRILLRRFEISLSKYLYALETRRLPMMRAYTFHDAENAVLVRIDSPKYLAQFEKLPRPSPKSPNSSFVKISEKLGAELDSSSFFMTLQLVVIDQNPYWWDKDESSINSQLVYIKIFSKKSRESDNYVKLVELENPLDIFLKVKRFGKGTLFSGQAAQPKDNEVSRVKDLLVTVCRVIPPQYGGGGKLFLVFEDFNPSDSLRVAVRSNFRPDYDFIMKFAHTVTTKNKLISLNYEIGENEVFVYIGILPGPTSVEKPSIKFHLRAFIIRCLSRQHSMWITDKCRVGSEASSKLIHCECRTLSLVGASIFRPNIELAQINNFQYSKYKEMNFLPVLAVFVLLILFAAFFLWAHLKHKQNVIKGKVIVMEDNFPGEEWAYLLGIYTGTRYSSGTTSNVGIKLVGDLAESRAHILRCSQRKTLQTYSEDWFLLFTPKRLGELQMIHLWLDYSGKSPSWYCRKVLVYDCSAKLKYIFRLGMWFYVDLVSDVVQVWVSPIDFRHSNFHRQFIDNIVFAFQEMHYFVSVVYHHPRSFLTLSEIIVALWTTMVLSCFMLMVYYKYDNKGVEDYPFYHLKMNDLVVSVFCVFPSILVSAVIRTVFRSKVITSNMSTWKIMSRKLQESAKRVEQQITDKDDKTENESSSDSHVPVSTKMNINTVKAKTVKRFFAISQQLPITLSHEFSDKVLIEKKRQNTAWIFVMTAFLGGCVLLVVEGLGMGFVKSCKWLTVCLTSAFFEFLFTDPMRIILLMFFKTALKKKQYDEPQFACDPNLGKRSELVGDEAYLKKLLLRRSRPEYNPLQPKKVNKIRAEKEKKLLWIFTLDLISILLIYFLVFFNTINSWSPDSFHLNSHLGNVMEDTVINKDMKLNEVRTYKNLNEYFRLTLNYVYCRTTWYNGMSATFAGDKFSESGWLEDYVYRLVGVIQIRQKRTTTEYCVPQILRHLFPSWMCKLPLTPETEDKANYSLGWGKPGLEAVSLHKAWKFRTTDFLATVHYGESGRYYSSSGYVLNLGRTYKETQTILWKAQEAGWLSQFTSAVFIDMCVYNPNINKLSLVTKLIEFDPSSRVLHESRIITFEAEQKNVSYETIFTVFLFSILSILVINLSISIFQEGFNFFYSIWNLIDLGIIVLFTVNLTSKLVNKFITNFSTQNKLNTGEGSFYAFGWIEYYNNRYKVMYMLLIIFCTVKLFKHFIVFFQVIPVLITFRLISKQVIRIMVLAIPLMYIKFIIIDTLLFNSQMQSSRFPLVNKIGLKNYSKMYIFPEYKTVAYYYCQFCTFLIVFFGVLIAYHYRIAKHSVVRGSNSLDIVWALREKIKKRKEKNKHRLRGGADSLIGRSSLSQPTHDVTQAVLCKSNPNPKEQDGFKPVGDFCASRVKQDKEGTLQLEELEMEMKNINCKLERIANNLSAILEDL